MQNYSSKYPHSHDKYGSFTLASLAQGTQHGKRVQSNKGAKNHAVILPDADKEVLEGSFACVHTDACIPGLHLNTHLCCPGDS